MRGLVNVRHVLVGDVVQRRVANELTPHTQTGWIAIALGFGVVVVGLLLFVVSNEATNGGDESAPLWLRALVPAAVLAVAIPAVILGFRSRRTDPSTLGTIGLATYSPRVGTSSRRCGQAFGGGGPVAACEEASLVDQPRLGVGLGHEGVGRVVAHLAAAVGDTAVGVAVARPVSPTRQSRELQCQRPSFPRGGGHLCNMRARS